MELLIALAALLALIFIALVLKRRSAKSKPANVPVSKVATLEAEAVQPKVETPVSNISSIERSVAVSNVSQPASVEPTEPKKSVSTIAAEEKIPEDSALRRHYLATRQAEKEAVANPYPSDSVLRRHHDSLSAAFLRQGLAAKPAVVSEQPVNHSLMPEDSTLRRHFLTQVQAEVEAQLASRPTDSALRRHYDSLVKAKMETYLKAA